MVFGKYHVVYPASALTWLMSYQMLDTTIDRGADKVYPKLGWTELGTMPNYGYSPADGSLVDEVWFYKDLRKSG